MLIRSILLLFILGFASAYAQSDTVKIVSYNLLNFPEGRNDCSNNTVVPNRADTLRKILQYLKPDIFVACEIQTEAGADSVLNRSLNVYGQSSYASADFNPENLYQGLYSQMYYNTDKLTLQYQDVIFTSPRSIDHYVLYMNDPNLSSYFDTTFIEVYMCHLKAGSGSSEASIRAQQAQDITDFIQTRPSDRHHLVCGDLNVYSSNEAAYQIFLNAGIGLYDPINSPGNWNSNSSFAAIHTQSTRTSQNLDCGSTGGTDDRFDHIMVSQNVMTGADSVIYLANTYKAVGNDGNHYNSSLISAPTNTMYPDSVVKALYYMSDHMPVTMSMKATYPTSNGLALYPSATATTCYGGNDGSATITPNDGQAPYTYLWDNNAGNQNTATATGLTSGSYCVQVTDNLGEVDNYCLYVPQPDSILISVFKNPDNGSCDGIAYTSITGGQAPYTVQWDDPSNQTSTTANNLCAGTYTISVTDNVGCTSSLTIEIADNSVSVDELLFDNLTVYPNPVAQVLHLKGLPSSTTIQVIDIQGKVIYHSISELTETMIDLSAIESGLYFLDLTSGRVSKRVLISKF